jgi:hypothetical protein
MLTGTVSEMALTYSSGAEVQAGDQIRYHGEAGRVEFVATATATEPEMAWYVDQFGVGCMLAVSSFGLVYVKPDDLLEFVGRGAE